MGTERDKNDKDNVPFDCYLEGGRKLYNILISGEKGSSRTGYGLPVFKVCGSRCVYCGFEMSDSYRSWLNISVEHVIPTKSTLKSWGGDYKNWLFDLANCVTCCRACNEFLNGYKTEEKPPKDLSEFFDLRDKIFLEKRKKVISRHQEEKKKYLCHYPDGKII
jgi:5-methylcytosine-specific restriction endonuclease McrA